MNFGLHVDIPSEELMLIPPQALIPLASDNTEAGKIKAAQALSKITITSNPQIAFPGERVRWLISSSQQLWFKHIVSQSRFCFVLFFFFSDL